MEYTYFLNKETIKNIINDKINNCLRHCYLFSSKDEFLNKCYIDCTSHVIMCQNNSCDHCPDCKKIEVNFHPDILYYPKGKSLATSDSEDIIEQAIKKPMISDKKIIVIQNMDNSSEEAQNKLLKTIEEPPRCAYFILAATQEKKLLQTVLSRSKKIELGAIERKTMEKMLEAEGVDKKEINICVACSDGVFSRALRLASDKEFISMYQNIFKCLYKMNSSRDVLPFVSLFSSKSIDKNEFADLFMLIVRDLIMIKTGNEGLVLNTHKIDEMNLIASGFSLVALYKIVEYCLQLKEDIVYNTSIGSSMDQFLLRVVEVKVKCKE